MLQPVAMGLGIAIQPGVMPGYFLELVAEFELSHSQCKQKMRMRSRQRRLAANADLDMTIAQICDPGNVANITVVPALNRVCNGAQLVSDGFNRNGRKARNVVGHVQNYCMKTG